MRKHYALAWEPGHLARALLDISVQGRQKKALLHTKCN